MRKWLLTSALAIPEEKSNRIESWFIIQYRIEIDGPAKIEYIVTILAKGEICVQINIYLH